VKSVGFIYIHMLAIQLVLRLTCVVWHCRSTAQLGYTSRSGAGQQPGGTFPKSKSAVTKNKGNHYKLHLWKLAGNPYQIVRRGSPLITIIIIIIMMVV